MPVRVGEDGSVRLFTRLTTFDRAVSLAFDQIRFFGAENPSIAKKLLDALRRLGALVPAPHRRPLVDEVEQTLEQVRRSNPPGGDLRLIERLGAECLAALRDGAPPPGEGAAPDTQRKSLTHR